MKSRRFFTLIALFLCTNCVGFSVVAVTPHRMLWLEAKQQAALSEKSSGKASDSTGDNSPTLTIALLRRWLAKVRAEPKVVTGMELDAIRQDWSSGVNILDFRRILHRAYRAAPQLRDSFSAKRLDAFLYLQTRDPKSSSSAERGRTKNLSSSSASDRTASKSARASLADLITWCKNPGIDIDGYDPYEHCSPTLLSWIADGHMRLDAQTMPERIARLEQIAECEDQPYVEDLLEFDLAHDADNADAVTRLSMRLIWDGLLQGCSLQDSDLAIRVLTVRPEAVLAAAHRALQQLQKTNPTDFELLGDRLPWPTQECDYARAPNCSILREYSNARKRQVLHRIIALVEQASETPTRQQQRLELAQALFAQAQAQLNQQQLDAARVSFAASMRANWNADTDYALRLFDALRAGAAPPTSVNPKPTTASWIYSLWWFDEKAFEKHKLIYRTLLPPRTFMQLQQRQAWERVLAQAAAIVNRHTMVEPAPALMPLHGTWHGNHLQIEDLELPWPAEFEWVLASATEQLPESERIALFARMQIVVK